MKTLKGIIIGYWKGFWHNFNTGHFLTVTYWKGIEHKQRNRIACAYCDKTHYKF